jgi:hypothetical protein
MGCLKVLMVIHVEICDVCGHKCKQVLPFSAEKNGKLIQWDVGECCMNTRFEIREHRKVDVVLTVQP